MMFLSSVVPFFFFVSSSLVCIFIGNQRNCIKGKAFGSRKDEGFFKLIYKEAKRSKSTLRDQNMSQETQLKPPENP